MPETSIPTVSSGCRSAVPRSHDQPWAKCVLSMQPLCIEVRTSDGRPLRRGVRCPGLPTGSARSLAVLCYLHPSADSTRRTLDSPCACSTTHAPIVGSTPSNTPSQQMESRSRLLPYVLPASVVSRRQTSVVCSVFLRTDVTTPLERAMAGLHEQSKAVASAAARRTRARRLPRRSQQRCSLPPFPTHADCVVMDRVVQPSEACSGDQRAAPAMKVATM